MSPERPQSQSLPSSKQGHGGRAAPSHRQPLPRGSPERPAYFLTMATSGRQIRKRTIGVIVGVAVAVALIAALAVIDFGRSRSYVGTGEVSPRERTTITSADGGIEVEIAPQTISGEGRLTVARTVDGDGRHGWSVQLDGAELLGEAVIRFTGVRLADGEPLPIVTSVEAGSGERRVATTVARDGDSIIVRTDHFSYWFLDRWDDLREKAISWLTDQISRAVSIAEDRRPRCQEEEAARDAGYSASSDEGRRVYWCLGMKRQHAVVEAVNARWYGVVFEYTPGLTLSQLDSGDLLQPIADLLKPRPSRGVNKNGLLGSGNKVQLDIDRSTTGPVGVKFEPDPAAYLLSALQFGVETYAMIAEKVGARDAKAKLLQLLDGAECLDSLVAMARTDLKSPQEAEEFFSHALEAAFSCIEATAADVDLGPLLNWIVKPIIWVISGVKAAVDGIVAAADIVFDLDGYQIRVLYAPKITQRSVENLLIPADSCWSGSDEIQLHNGEGERVHTPDEATSILSADLVGTVDLTGDGVEEAVVALRCTWVPLSLCCAGRESTLDVITVLDLNGATPRRVGQPIAPQSVRGSDGTKHPRKIDTRKVLISGKRIVTWEYLTYRYDFDPAEVARLEGRVRHSLVNGRWVSTKL